MDTVLTSKWAIQPEMMKSVRNHYNFFQKGFVYYNVISNGPTDYKTIAWISHREDLNKENFEHGRRHANQYIHLSNMFKAKSGQQQLNYMRYPFEYYRILYKDVRPSDTEIEFLNKIESGINGYFFYILHRL